MGEARSRASFPLRASLVRGTGTCERPRLSRRNDGILTVVLGFFTVLPIPLPASVKVTLPFEDGTSAEQTYPGLRAHSRFQRTRGWVPPAGRGPALRGLGTTQAQVVVERAMYWNAAGERRAAGTNALAMRLQ